MDRPHAICIATIEVFAVRDACLLCRHRNTVVDGPMDPGLAHAPFTLGSMGVAVTTKEMFVPLEIWQHVTPTPAGEPGVSPPVVISLMASDGDHAVDRGRATEYLTPGYVHPSATQTRLGFGFPAPVVPRIANGMPITNWQAEQERPISPCAFHVRDGDYFGVATILFLGAVMGAGASQIGGRRLHFRRLPN